MITMMKKIAVFIFLVFGMMGSWAQNTDIKALVGGTLIDGYGSTPIRNSVIRVMSAPADS